MTRCRAVVTANTCADIPDTPGHGLAWLVSCPACVTRSVAAASHNGQPWQGVGEWYTGDLGTARHLAERHSSTRTEQPRSWYERDEE